MRQDWLAHGRVWVNKECFEQCLPTVRPWIDINSLTGHLVQHGIVNDQDDHHQLHNYVDPPGVKVVKLLGLAEKAGPYGYYLLYMCIRDTQDDQMGHGDAARELHRYGELGGGATRATSVHVFKLGLCPHCSRHDQTQTS